MPVARQPHSSSVSSAVPASANTSRFVRVALNSDKVAACAARANSPISSGDTVAASGDDRAAIVTPNTRERRFLGGETLTALHARAQARWSAEVLDPFRCLTAQQPPDRVLPIDQKRTIDIGMGESLAISPPSLPATFSGLALEEFDELPAEAQESLQHFTQLQRSSATFKAWQTHWNLLVAYCLRWNRRPLPMSVATATAIAAHMARTGYGYKYIRNVFSTCRKAHMLTGLSDPTATYAFVQYVKVIAKELGTESKHPKAPILFPLLRRIGERAQSIGTLESLQEWVGIDLEFFTALRRANIVALDIEDMHRLTHGYEVHVRRGKTHQAHARTIPLGPIPWDDLVCPVTNLDRWLGVLKNAGFTSGPLLRHLGPGGVLTTKRLSDRTLTRNVKKYVGEFALSPEEFSSTSLRSGLITQARLNRVPNPDIKRVTLHEDDDSLDPYDKPGELAANLSIAVAYGTDATPGEMTPNRSIAATYGVDVARALRANPLAAVALGSWGQCDVTT
jgi:hypothetical protein